MKVKSVEAKGVLADLLANFDEKEYEEVKKEMIMEDYNIRRKEEIRKAAYNNDRESSKENQSYFVDGAEWADDNPKEGLVDINKAVNWLESVNLDYYQIREGVFAKELVTDFRRAMEE